jgi:hypothetical protein
MFIAVCASCTARDPFGGRAGTLALRRICQWSLFTSNWTAVTAVTASTAASTTFEDRAHTFSGKLKPDTGGLYAILSSIYASRRTGNVRIAKGSRFEGMTMYPLASARKAMQRDHCVLHQASRYHTCSECYQILRSSLLPSTTSYYRLTIASSFKLNSS